MKINNLGKLALIPVLVMGSANVSAKMLWSDFSLSLLTGSDYLNTDTETESKRNVFTFEHASGHNWGSTFLFVDRLSNPDDVYGEFSINPDLYKGDEFIKNAFVATQIEFGTSEKWNGTTSNFNNYLAGVGVNLAIPGFKYFNVIYYRRFQNDLGIERGDNNQLTITWRYEAGDFRIDGFLDAVDSADNKFGESAKGFNFTPQIKYNVAPILGLETGRLDVGIEYVYWKNKYGFKGQTENNPNLLVKWHF